MVLQIKIPITSLVVDDACMFLGPGDSREEAYVVTFTDPSKQIYQGVKAKIKTPILWSVADLVTKIDVPGIGSILLGL